MTRTIAIRTIVAHRRGAMLLLAAMLAGCGTPVAKFQLDVVYVRKTEKANKQEGEKIPEPQLQSVADTMAALFGTPDDPALPPASANFKIDDVLNLQKLKLAAGPVRTGKDGVTVSGLYRRHCVHCHGVTGDGRGPTAAYLNPYPRDYRMGIFKMKTTLSDAKPTDNDLKAVLHEGINGTAMPSFKVLLTSLEEDALVHYVKYLSIRGEVERQLIDEAVQLEKDDKLNLAYDDLIADKVNKVVDAWRNAANRITPEVKRPNVDLATSIERGRKIFYTVGNCYTCHGNTQLGYGGTPIYDEWTKPLEPDNAKAAQEYVNVYHAFPPRANTPRNLRAGIYRFGRRPIDIYLRIHNGIYGSGMPAITVQQPGTPRDPSKYVTAEEIWHVVDYVLSLPYEPASKPLDHAPENKRERN